MTFRDEVLGLGAESPRSVRGIDLPRRQAFHGSAADWRDEVLYFLLPDRFSDGREDSRPLVERASLDTSRPAAPDGTPWRWDRWARAGGERFQGGTIRGITSRLDYLAALGATTLWIGPVFKQRVHENSYHGYGAQNFLAVDPRFGTLRDLVELCDAAHARGFRIVLDVIFNHSGSNWRYRDDAPGGPEMPRYTVGRHPFGAWRGGGGGVLPPRSSGEPFASMDDAVFPDELQDEERYTRAGVGSLGAGEVDDPGAEHKRSDFFTLRDLRVDDPAVLSDLVRCYKYWIALTDCDGFRIDTLKHVTPEQARNFCGAIKEYAANLGKHDFLLIGEIAGGDAAARRYLDVVDRNLNAALDIGEMRPLLSLVAKGLVGPRAYFAGFEPGRATLGSHRNLGSRHVSILDDHDHVFGSKLRFSAESASDVQVVAGVALQLFTLGIPCIYYGTEQSLGGPEPGERRWLPEWGSSDRYLREAMFGPRHPRADAALDPGGASGALDSDLPGFGPFGTAGAHCFDPSHPAYRRIAALTALRRRFPVLRGGRQYLRPISLFGRPFDEAAAGEIVAWSRILDDEEALCIVNGHGRERRGGDVLVDAGLSPTGSTLTVVLNTEGLDGRPVSHPVDSRSSVFTGPGGAATVAIRDVGPSEVLVLVNRP